MTDSERKKAIETKVAELNDLLAESTFTAGLVIELEILERYTVGSCPVPVVNLTRVMKSL